MSNYFDHLFSINEYENRTVVSKIAKFVAINAFGILSNSV